MLRIGQQRVSSMASRGVVSCVRCIDFGCDMMDLWRFAFPTMRDLYVALFAHCDVRGVNATECARTPRSWDKGGKVTKRAGSTARYVPCSLAQNR